MTGYILMLFQSFWNNFRRLSLIRASCFEFKLFYFELFLLILNLFSHSISFWDWYWCVLFIPDLLSSLFSYSTCTLLLHLTHSFIGTFFWETFAPTFLVMWRFTVTARFTWTWYQWWKEQGGPTFRLTLKVISCFSLSLCSYNCWNKERNFPYLHILHRRWL